MAGSHLTAPRRAGLARAALTVVLASSSLTGCAALRGGAPEARALTVELPISRSAAVRRTLTAFREQGYRVRAALTSGLTPETEPFRQGDDAEAVFRAVISGSERSAKVVLSGTYRRLRLGGAVRAGEKEVRDTDDPIERVLWNRLQQLRLDIMETVR